jgi:hypothetical protein
VLAQELRYIVAMAQAAVEQQQRVDVRLDPEELRALDELCTADLRSRPSEIRWLIAAERTRRSEALIAKRA